MIWKRELRSAFAVVATVLAVATTAFADRTVTCREKPRQDKFPSATDLHLKVWQKEDNIDIKSWSVVVGGADIDRIQSARGSQPPPYDAIDNGMHAVDIDIDFTPPGVDRFDTITVDIQLLLTSWNTQRIADLEWTFAEEEAKIAPNHGWALSPPLLDPQYPGEWVHLFEICNDDTLEPLVLKNLQVAIKEQEANMDDLETFTYWDATLIDTAGLLLLPGECVEFAVPGPPGSPADSQHVWGHYEVWGAARQDSIPVDSWFDHYDFLCIASAIDDPGEFETPASTISLAQNDPNPFASGTVIAYSVPMDCHVTLAVYDAAGRRVKMLADGWQSAGPGRVLWDGTDQGGEEVASGVYFCRLRAGSQLASRKLVVLR